MGEFTASSREDGEIAAVLPLAANVLPRSPPSACHVSTGLPEAA